MDVTIAARIQCPVEQHCEGTYLNGGRMHAIRVLVGGTWSLALVLLSACSEEHASLSPGGGAGVDQFVTGAAAEALDASGHFRMSAPPAADLPSISQTQAEELALALVHGAAPVGGLAGAEAERGTPISWTELSVCRRTLYALSSWLPLDASIVASPYGAATQRGFGPHYLVSLCEHGAVPALTIAVSAYSTDLSVENGDLVYPRVGGSWFQWRGVPRSQEAELGVGPERAVRAAAQLTGRKVTAVPDLIIPDRRDGGVIDARWRISLDSLVTLRTKDSRESLTVGKVYVRWSRRFNGEPTVDIEVPNEDPDETFEYRTALPKDPSDTDLPVAHGVARRRADFPSRYETVASGDDVAH